MTFKVGDLIRIKEERVPIRYRQTAEAMAVFLIIEYRDGSAFRRYNAYINREEYIEYDKSHKYYKVLYPDGMKTAFFSADSAVEQYEKISI